MMTPIAQYTVCSLSNMNTNMKSMLIARLKLIIIIKMGPSITKSLDVVQAKAVIARTIRDVIPAACRTI